MIYLDRKALLALSTENIARALRQGAHPDSYGRDLDPTVSSHAPREPHPNEYLAAYHGENI